MSKRSLLTTRAKTWALIAGGSAGLLLTLSTARATVTFGQSTLSASDPAFLNGEMVAVFGNNYTLTLPNFTIGEFATGTFNLSLTVMDLAASEFITSDVYSLSGSFSGGGVATANIRFSGSPAPDSVSTSFTFPPPNPALGVLQLPVPTKNAVVDLMITLDTSNVSGTAGVNTISFNLNTTAVPEPSTTATFLTLGLGALGAMTWRRARVRAGRAASLTLFAAGILFLVPPTHAQTLSKNKLKAATKSNYRMTDMARVAQIYQKWVAQGRVGVAQGNKIVFTDPNGIDGGDGDGEDFDNSDPDAVVPYPGGQAEYSLAVDSTGQHIVLGYNDTRGFNRTPVSVSGYYYSDDGGQTFNDGGQLTTGTTVVINGTSYPQVFGDTDIKYAGGSSFIVSSIYVKPTGNPVTTPQTLPLTVQTLCIHRSTDFGHTFQGPFEVTAATAPVTPTDSSDKEFIDIDPMTGRLIIAWTNFISNAPAENRAAYCDNALTATPPTWSAGTVVVPNTFDGGYPQGIMPRFSGTGQAYIVTNARNKANNASVDPSGYTVNNEVFNVSTDNGVTFGAPKDIVPTDFKNIDNVLGNDRVHSFPFMAVDQSNGPRKGYIYVVYANGSTPDGGDIAFQVSTDQGATFSAPKFINARPGNDREQWFPTISVDKNTGRVTITYLDQGIATSGDLTEVSAIYSDDGGATFSPQRPLTTQPFKAGWGNDTGQPNLGDYNMTASQNGEVFTVHAITELKPYGDGQAPAGNANAGSFTTPDAYFFRTNFPARPSLRMTEFAFPNSGGLGAVSFTESGGNNIVDAGDQVKLTIPLQNFVTNSVSNPAAVTGISATLSSSTPGVSFLRATVAYPNIAAGATANNAQTFVMKLASNFVPGTPIQLLLTVTSNQGTATFPYTQPTGSPVSTTIFAENFDSVAPGSLPAGWATSHGGGANTVPWTTSNTAFQPSGTPNNAAFHQNANDSTTTNHTRFERLFSPVFNVPANAEYVTLDMDVAYNTEDQPGYNVLAYDGFLLRITDMTTGRVLRSVLLEAFEEEFSTGNLQHYPKQLPRNSSTAYLQDLSCWAGFSNGFVHVRAKLPATELASSTSGVSLAGSSIQLRFEYTQDSGGTGADLRPPDGSAARNASGVAFDNLVVKAVTSRSVELARLNLVPVSGQPGQYTGTLTSQVPAPSGGITATLSSSAPAQTTLPDSVTIPAGQTTSSPFSVSLGSGAFGTKVTITATGPTNSVSAAALVQ